MFNLPDYLLQKQPFYGNREEPIVTGHALFGTVVEPGKKCMQQINAKQASQRVKSSDTVKSVLSGHPGDQKFVAV
jgi:D-arabinose 1-dehydrogenase-like Zn-dependent alcohol dehydrogenase